MALESVPKQANIYIQPRLRGYRTEFSLCLSQSNHQDPLDIKLLRPSPTVLELDRRGEGGIGNHGQPGPGPSQLTTEEEKCHPSLSQEMNNSQQPGCQATIPTLGKAFSH